MSTCLVIDALKEGDPRTIDIDSDTTVMELMHMIHSLDLPSCAAGAFQVCHDGRVLEDQEASLASAGVLECPVVVILAKREARTPPRAAPRVAASAAAAAPTAEGLPRPEAAPAAPPRPAAPREVPEDAVCRICFSDGGRLISPCMCTGSMRYVHPECLNEWRSQSANPRSFYQCDQCNYKYNIERTKWAGLLEDERLVRAVAALLLLVGLCVGGLVLGSLGVQRAFYQLVDFYPDRPHHWGHPRLLWVAAHWGWRLDYLVAGLLALAAVGLSQSVRQAWRMNRHGHESQWLMGIVTAFAASGIRIVRVFAVGGAIHSTYVAVGAVEAVAKEMLTRWGTLILEVQRPD